MSEIKKRRIRCEILEDVEILLNDKIKSLEIDISYNSSDDLRNEDGNLPEWRLDGIADDNARIAECREIIKALSKMC